jgi:hypothetical protein
MGRSTVLRLPLAPGKTTQLRFVEILTVYYKVHLHWYSLLQKCTKYARESNSGWTFLGLPSNIVSVLCHVAQGSQGEHNHLLAVFPLAKFSVILPATVTCDSDSNSHIITCLAHLGWRNKK